VSACAQVLWHSSQHNLPHLGLFASRDIKAGEELTYDYKYQVDENNHHGLSCFCGSPSCRGRLF